MPDIVGILCRYDCVCVLAVSFLVFNQLIGFTLFWNDVSVWLCDSCGYLFFFFYMMDFPLCWNYVSVWLCACWLWVFFVLQPHDGCCTISLVHVLCSSVLVV